MYISICFEFDKFFFESDKFCLCEEEEEKKKKGISSTSNVYMNWLKLNMKI